MTLARRIRAAFVGSNSLLARCAEALLRAGHMVCCVITSNEVVARWAGEQDIRLFGFGNGWETALERDPVDVLFSIGHLRILPSHVLALPRVAAINFHDGPLPRYAGLNAPSWAILNGERVHGVTWHLMTPEVDRGDILVQHLFPLTPTDTALTLNVKCYEAGAKSFVELLDQLAHGRLSPRPQQGAVLYFSRRDRPPNACTLQWHRPVKEWEALGRALDYGPADNPLGLPKVWVPGGPLVVGAIRCAAGASRAAPGEVIELGTDGAWIAAADGVLHLAHLTTLEGRPVAGDALASRGVGAGMRLPELDAPVARALSDFDRECAPHEAFWVRRLAELAPFAPPIAGSRETRGGSAAGAGTEARTHRVCWITGTVPADAVAALGGLADGRAGDALAAAFAWRFAQMGGAAAFDVATPAALLAGLPPKTAAWFAPHVPMRVAAAPGVPFADFAAQLAAELDTVRRHRTFARDVWQRYRALRAVPLERRTADLPIVLGIDDGRSALPEDVQLAALAAPGGDAWRIGYDAGRLTGDAVAGFAKGFSLLLLALAGKRRRGTTDAAHRGRPASPVIHELFEAQVARTPDAVAVIHGGVAVSYRELDRRAESVAQALRARGVGRDTLVGLCVGRGVDLVAGVLGILKAGGAYVPLDPKLPASRIQFMLEDADLAHLVTTRDLAPRVRGPGTVVLLDALPSTGQGVVRADGDAQASDLAYCIYTSGSTGRPKGVLVEHRNVVACFDALDERIPRGDRLVWLAVTNLSFDISVLELLWPLTRGATVVVSDEEIARAAAGAVAADATLARLIDVHGVTHLQCTPSLARLLLSDAATRRALGRLTALLVGGEELPPDLARDLCAAVAHGVVLNMYGPTEATIWSSTATVRPTEGKVPIGRPIAGTTFVVVDADLAPVADDVLGELLIAGASVARGYLRRPELTAERFLERVPAAGNLRGYRSGDLVRRRADGTYEWLGRLDDQVKIRGHRVELGEIEAALRRHPAVRYAAVAAHASDGGPQLIGYVVPAPGQSPPPFSVLREHLAALLPEPMIPSAFVTLAELPLTPSGKLDRRALPAPAAPVPPAPGAPAADRGGASAVTASLEARVAAVWTEILGRADIGRDDNFFEVGGDSLSAVRLMVRLQEILQRAVPLHQLFVTPTVAGIAAAIEAGEGELEPASDPPDAAAAQHA